MLCSEVRLKRKQKMQFQLFYRLIQLEIRKFHKMKLGKKMYYYENWSKVKVTLMCSEICPSYHVTCEYSFVLFFFQWQIQKLKLGVDEWVKISISLVNSFSKMMLLHSFNRAREVLELNHQRLMASERIFVTLAAIPAIIFSLGGLMISCALVKQGRFSLHLSAS